MNPYFSDGACALHLGDCRDVLPTLADASVDAVVCDPPYEINFMGRGWDSTGIAYDVNMWRQCLRVLKPGGHLLAFGATRTYHRLAVAIEDAGFEIRDSIHWIYGNGFPKGQDIGKSIDRRRDDRQDILRVTAWLAEARDAAGWTNRRLDALWGFNGMASHWTTQGVAAVAPTLEQWQELRQAVGFDDTEILPVVERLNSRKGETGEAWGQRPEAVHEAPPGLAATWTNGAGWNGATARRGTAVLPEAAAWEGWNTALKPAHEPIVLARKSTGFNTTVANVLEHGTGAINVDACRVNAGQDYRDKCASVVGLDSNRNGATLGAWTGVRENSAHDLGRWPTNVVFSHSLECDDVCAPGCPVTGLGENARFFPVFRYEPKAPASERPRLDDGTVHNTVKPLDLMRWLVRLVTPPGGTVLDPFVGSGTSLEACVIEGFHGIGIEQHQPYADLCVKRLSKPIQAVLGFEEAS